MSTALNRFLCGVACAGTVIAAQAQNEEDALRASMVAPGGTARSIGLANAFGAVGADPSAIGINPAGLGMYRTSEISFSPSLEVNSTSSQYAGSNATDAKSRFAFGNLALILNSPAESKDSEWRSGTFGVILNRQATHHWGRQAIGKGISTSILDDLAGQADGILADDLYDALPFTSGLAYDTYGIDPIDPNDSLGRSYVAALPSGALVDQTITTDSRGATNNTAFFYSGNYMDKLYLGLAVGIVGYRYSHIRTHSETVPDENIDLKDLRYREELSINGNGVDVKAGVIYRFHDRLRAGVAVHSPMWMTMNDAYNTSMNTTFRTPSATDGRTAYSATSPDGIFTYKVTSPMRVVTSATYVVGTLGLVSVDHEYADYSQMRLRPSTRLDDSYAFTTENEAIGRVFRPTHQVRIGTEWRSGNWYLRMGWGTAQDAYRTDDLRHTISRRTIAGGVGYRTAHLSVDLGVTHLHQGNNNFPYDPAYANVIREERNTLRSMITVAVRP